MAEHPALILRARTLLPIAQPPIDDGAVLVWGNRIRSVCRWADARSSPRGRVCDLGEVIVLPGLVNAHCHLDYTDMAGLLPPPKTFTDWIHLMLTAKAQWGYCEYAQSWLHGAHMLVRTGTTTVADIEAVPELLPEVWESTPLRVHSFLEMTGIRARRDPKAILQEAVNTADALFHPRSRAVLSPHAPYSTMAELMRASVQVSRERGWPLSTHLAESTHEFEMFMHGRGSMYEWLKRNQRNMSDCGIGSPVSHLARHKILGNHLIAAHVNTLARGDATLLGREGVHVAHCPRSHVYFQHPPFLRKRLVNAGVNVCLGTDSLATVRKQGRQKLELNLFEEMRALMARDKSVSAAEVLRMATINGARALGQGGQIGELSEKAFADLIAVSSTAAKTDAYEAVINHTGPVAASMIEGRWVIPPRTA